MNITEVEIGQKLKVLKIEGRGSERRLFEMGIMPGVELILIARHPFKGPLVIRVGNADVALGRSIANKVKVEAV
jgi:ferrous iron transport protein A